MLTSNRSRSEDLRRRELEDKKKKEGAGGAGSKELDGLRRRSTAFRDMMAEAVEEAVETACPDGDVGHAGRAHAGSPPPPPRQGHHGGGGHAAHAHASPPPVPGRHPSKAVIDKMRHHAEGARRRSSTRKKSLAVLDILAMKAGSRRAPGEKKPAAKKRDMSLKCTKCKRYGHSADDCPR